VKVGDHKKKKLYHNKIEI